VAGSAEAQGASAAADPPLSTSNYLVYPGFTGKDGGCPSGQVFLVPPNVNYKTPTASTTFTIPQIYTGDANVGGHSLTGNGDFTITFGPAPSTTPPQFPANVPTNVTLTGANLWSCGAARTTLMQNFVSFLEAVETTLELTGIIAPGATATIAAQLADRIPAPPLETLFYRYAFVPGTGAGTVPSVDVRPGMRLRIETETSQYVAPSSALNGYVGGGRLSVNVVSVPQGTQRVVAFDPFLGTIRAPATAGAGSPLVAGGLVDLQAPAGARPHWRLLYPSSMQLPSQPGDYGLTDNVALVGTATLANMAAVTSSYPNQAPAATPPDVYAIFGGRAMVVPEIPIRLSVGQQTTIQYVALGTTLANVAEQYVSLPRGTANPGVQLNRLTTAVSPPATTAAPVQLYTSQLVPVMVPGMLDLPLIAGDNVTIPGF
jgi:hypothetical protein